MQTRLKISNDLSKLVISRTAEPAMFKNRYEKPYQNLHFIGFYVRYEYKVKKRLIKKQKITEPYPTKMTT